MSKKEPSRSDYKAEIIYVDLDALLDTRLGTLAKLGDNYPTNALSADYANRDRDEFPDVSYEVFKKAYEARNEETLALSTFTNVFIFLKTCIKANYEAAVTNPNTHPLQITVNVEPYDLDEETMSDISVAIANRLSGMVDVEVIKMKDEELTVPYCKENFVMMIRYTYDPWLKIHRDSFEHYKMPEVSVIGPAIFQSYPTESEFRELKEQNLHPFKAAELCSAPFFCLRLLDVEAFCIAKEILDGLDKVKNKSKDGIKPEEPKPPEPNANKEDTQNASSASANSDGFDLL